MKKIKKEELINFIDAFILRVGSREKIIDELAKRATVVQIVWFTHLAIREAEREESDKFFTDLEARLDHYGRSLK